MRVVNLALRGLLALGIALVVAATAALGYRAWRQHENARLFAIRTPHGVEQATYLRLGGIDQWVQIRGQDRDNPVLLYVHGGPGVAVTPFAAVFRPWEKDFTVVLWDQRCAGKTYSRNGARSCQGMSLARVAQDGVELSDWLRRRFHKKTIVLVGQSWGSMVALRMAHDRPDLYSAYVGTGQVVSIAEKEPVVYDRAMARLRADHDEAGVRTLQALGRPPYRSSSDLMVERNLSLRHDSPAERGLESRLIRIGLVAPGWSLWDAWQYFQAGPHAEAATFAASAGYDAHDLGRTFALPVFVVEGADDNVTPAALARQYVAGLDAPQKAFVALPGAGHSVVITEPEAFLRELDARVRPIALRAQ